MRHVVVLLLAVVALLATAQPAHAVIYGGNPKLTFDVDRIQHDLGTGTVDLWKVRMSACGGGYTDYVLNEDGVDPVAGYTLDIDAGNWCGATFYWASTMYLDGVGSQGAFVLSYDESLTYVALASPTIPLVALTPWDVVSGYGAGGDPKIHVVIQ